MAMRQERMQKRQLRRRGGGAGNPEPLDPAAPRSEATKRTIQKTDDFLRRIDRLTR
jgi:hypothetical protein